MVLVSRQLHPIQLPRHNAPIAESQTGTTYWTIYHMTSSTIEF